MPCRACSDLMGEIRFETSRETSSEPTSSLSLMTVLYYSSIWWIFVGLSQSHCKRMLILETLSRLHRRSVYQTTQIDLYQSCNPLNPMMETWIEVRRPAAGTGMQREANGVATMRPECRRSLP
eukprot:3913625-Amphidinium_carterae.1